MSTEQQVLSILERVLNTPRVREDLGLHLYQAHLMNSLQRVKLMVAIADTFGFDISPAELEPEEWATPALIVDYVQRRMS